jgi:hypothetical protein
MKKVYSTVRNFLRDHDEEDYTVYDVSRILGIELKKVERLVSMGLIETSNVGNHVLRGAWLENGGESMSLWDKWEREKLEKQGIKVEHPRDVEIHAIHPKNNIRRQICLAAGVAFICILLVHAAIAFEVLYTGRRWSETYIVRLFAAREAEREAMSENP